MVEQSTGQWVSEGKISAQLMLIRSYIPRFYWEKNRQDNKFKFMVNVWVQRAYNMF